MIIGHVGLAFAVWTRAPRITLGGLIAASLLPDLVRAVLVFTPLGHGAQLFTHELPWGLLLPVAAGVVALLTSRSTATGGVVALVVLSHSALDLVSGSKELWDGGPQYGAGLEQVAAAEFVLEALLAWLGWRLLQRHNAPGWAGSRALLLLLLLVQAAYAVTIENGPWSCKVVWTQITGRFSRVIGC